MLYITLGNCYLQWLTVKTILLLSLLHSHVVVKINQKLSKFMFLFHFKREQNDYNGVKPALYGMGDG